MIPTLGDILPAAVAVALSPIPIVAVILVLGTPSARTNGPAFAVGWISGLSAVSLVVLLIASGASDPDSAASTGVNWFQTAIGVLFLVMAARQWQRRPRRGEEPELPGWVAKIDTITPVRSLALGVTLSGLNPKNLALTAAAAATVAQAGLGGEADAATVAVFVVIGSVTVVVPVVFHLVASDRADDTLGRIKDVMADHNAVVMTVILLLLGAKLLGDGLGALFG